MTEDRSVVEAEKERADGRLVELPSEPTDHAVGSSLPLHFLHRTAAGLVAQIPPLHDHAVDARVSVEPSCGTAGVVRDRREAEWRRWVAKQPFEGGPPLGERPAGEIVVAERHEIEGHQRRRSLVAPAFHERRGGMQPLEQRDEVAPDDELAVEEEAVRRELEQRLGDLGEVAPERTTVPAAKINGGSVAGRQAAEAVPLRLVEQAVTDRELTDEASEHWLHRFFSLPIVRGRKEAMEGSAAASPVASGGSGVSERGASR